MAGAAGVGAITAGTRIHGGDEHEFGGECGAAERAADGDAAVFEGLAQDFEGLAVEFGKLVEEKNAFMCKTDLAGLRRAPAADEAGVADGVMRRSERADGHQRLAGAEEAHRAVDAGGFQALLGRQGGHDRRQSLGEKGLAGAGGADEEDVVGAGGGDQHGALGVVPGLSRRRSLPRSGRGRGRPLQGRRTGVRGRADRSGSRPPRRDCRSGKRSRPRHGGLVGVCRRGREARRGLRRRRPAPSRARP